MYTKNNVIVFKNDEEFYKWCIDPELYIKEGKSCSYTTWDFSYDYKKALREGKKFAIYTNDSRVLKNGDISYRTITKKVENVVPYNKLLMEK